MRKMIETISDVLKDYYDKLPGINKYNSTGLPFHSMELYDCIMQLRDFRVFKDKPSIMIIDGMSGLGKTTMGYHVSDIAQGKLVDKDIQHGMGAHDFIRKVKNCIKEKYLCPIYDEAGDSDKRQHYSIINKMIRRFADLFRTFHLLPIFILPVFDRLEDDIFDKGLPRLLLHCNKRGDYSGDVSVYGLRRMLYLRRHMKDKDILSKQKAYSFVRPNFRVHFKDLPKKRREELDRYSSLEKLKEFHDIDIANRGLLSYNDISKQLGRSKVWVQKTVKKLKIKEIDIWKKEKFFDKAILRSIENEIKYN